MVNSYKLDFPVDRLSLLRLASLFSHEEGTCLLYSGENKDYSNDMSQLPHAKVKAISYLALFPVEQIWVYGDRQWKHQLNKKKEKHLTLCPWEGLKQLLPSFNHDPENSKIFTTSKTSHPSYFGFFGYEMGHYADVQKSVNYNYTSISAATPDSYFQRTALVISVDHTTGSTELIVEEDWQEILGTKEQQSMKQLLDPDWWSQFLYQNENENNENDNNNENAVIYQVYPQNLCVIEQRESKASYISKVKRIQEFINEGDVYQANLSQQFILRSITDPIQPEGDSFNHSDHCDPFDLFESLTKINPAPYSAYFKLPNFAIACSSPELFLQKKGNQLLTRPIKGTIARGVTPEQDASNRYRLLTSEKDRAELLMIVDLMRNDLGKISLPASVKTEEIWGCEAYDNVFHLVATISSSAIPNLHPLDLVRSCFPGGSITGCPKLKAIEVIHAMENRRRGIYTGSIGYFCDNGDFAFNIAIRTAVVQDGRIELQLGGAIVADSDPEQEYAETLQKGDSIFKSLGVQCAMVSK